MADGYNIKGDINSAIKDGFSNSKTQKMLLDHLKTRESHEHEKAKLEAQFQQEKDIAKIKREKEESLLKIQLGRIGRLFGGNKNISHNIVAILISLILLFDIVSSIGIYCWGKEIDESELDLIKIIWQESAPLITLALGYVFGRKSDS